MTKEIQEISLTEIYLLKCNSIKNLVNYIFNIYKKILEKCFWFMII